MSTPLTSAAPTALTDSGQVADGSGRASWVADSIETNAWITGLSPAGATVYDTGWVSTPAPVVGTDWTIVTYNTRRIGKTVYVYLRASATGTHTLTATTGAITNSTVCTLDATWRPARNIGHGLSGGNSRVASGHVLNTGAMVIQSVAGTANVVAADLITLAGQYLID
jgi:hypothetical protein